MILSAAGAIEIGFCDSAGNGFFTEQPADQLGGGRCRRTTASAWWCWSAAKGVRAQHHVVPRRRVVVAAAAGPRRASSARSAGHCRRQQAARPSAARPTASRRGAAVDVRPYPSACSKGSTCRRCRSRGRSSSPPRRRRDDSCTGRSRPSAGRRPDGPSSVVHKYRRKVDEAAATSKPRPWWRHRQAPRRRRAPRRAGTLARLRRRRPRPRALGTASGSAASAADDDGKGDAVGGGGDGLRLIGAGIALLIAPEAGEGWPRSAAEMRRTRSWRLAYPSG